LCGAFLEELEEQGRLGGGRALGAYVRALRDAFNPKPIRAPSRVGRNDPCPCGSGKKYKRCCMNLLG
ncbi:MAG: SEC-C metal-binding domain-containing protein, partial [Planctomycetota bacterium]